MSNTHRTAIAAAWLAAIAAAGAGHAATLNRDDYESGARACQGATAGFAAVLRARPLAVANVGDGTAFITCAWSGREGIGSTRRLEEVKVTLVNRAEVAREVSCTFVHGIAVAPADQIGYVTRSVEIAPGQSAALTFTQADVTQWKQQLSHPQISCAAPPLVEVASLGTWYVEEVGQ